MAIHVTTRLVNAADTSFPKIHIRRLYQVFFISEDLEWCDIYTCVVLAAQDGSDKIKKIDTAFDFRIQFGLTDVSEQILQNNAKLVNCLPEFRKNDKPWQFMWGANCRPKDLQEKDIRSALLKHIQNVSQAKNYGFDDLVPTGTAAAATPTIDYQAEPAKSFVGALKAKSTVLLRGSGGDDSIENLAICLPSAPATLTAISPSTFRGTSAVCEYVLRGTADWIAGCDLIDWSHTRIPINRTDRRGNVKLECSWIFDAPEDSGADRLSRFPCDEIRAYVIPPPHKRLDKDHSTLTYSTTADPRDGDTVDRNALDEMISDNSVYFEEWERKFHVAARTVYRIRGAKFEEPANNFWRFTFGSSIVRPSQLDTKLLASIILPIIAAFGIDSIRLKDIAVAAKASAVAGAWLGGQFPYWGLFEPVQAWVFFLLAMAGQFFLDFSWWNERQKVRPLIFRMSRWITYPIAALWFFGVFVFGVRETSEFISWCTLHRMSWEGAAGVLRWSWTLACAVPMLSIALAFLFYPDSYHFLGFYQQFRRKWYRYIKPQSI